MNLPLNDASQELLNFLFISTASEIQIGPPISPYRNEHIAEMLSFLDPDMPRDEWLKIGMALNADRRDINLWIDWSSKSKTKFRLGDCEKRWKSFGKKHGITIGTLIKMAEDKGWKSPYKKTENSIISKNTDRIKLYHWSELNELSPKRYLVKGLIDENDLSCAFGQSNSGKTFAALDLALHISLGWEWSGKKVRQGSVVYIAAEGGLSVNNRLNAFRKHHNLEKLSDFYLIPSTVLLNKETSMLDELVACLIDIKDIKLIVIDTLARSIGGCDENSSADMGAFIKNCDDLRKEIGAHVMVIHHKGKDLARGARGHSSLKAALDTEIEVSNTEGIITMAVTKQRDRETGAEFNFKLKPYAVGEDEDEDPIYSCALVPVNSVLKKTELKGQLAKMYRLINQLIEYKGEVPIPQNGFPNKKCIDSQVLRQKFIESKIANTDRADSINRIYNRIKNELLAQGFIEELDPYIWISDKKDKTDGQKSLSAH